MRVLIDLTNSPHVPFFAPLVRRLEQRGAQVDITARRFAQTVELSALHGLDVTVIGVHGGGTTFGKARAAVGRTLGLWRHARAAGRSTPFDVALSHGSTDLPWVARRMGVPHVTIFDYEFATLQHGRNVPRSWKVVTPDAIPAARLDGYGAAGKLAQYPGLKEDYYLADAELAPWPGSAVRAGLGIADDAVLAVLRPPPDLALYHRGHVNEVFGAALARLAGDERVVVVVLPRTDAQAASVREGYAGNDRVVVPETAVDAQALLGATDLVISAGGTMNREAVALGIPVWTTFAGRIGAVDEALLADGRLRQLTSVDDLLVERRAGSDVDGGSAPRGHLRDPDDLLDLLLDGLPLLG